MESQKKLKKAELIYCAQFSFLLCKIFSFNFPREQKHWKFANRWKRQSMFSSIATLMNIFIIFQSEEKNNSNFRPNGKTPEFDKHFQ